VVYFFAILIPFIREFGGLTANIKSGDGDEGREKKTAQKMEDVACVYEEISLSP